MPIISNAFVAGDVTLPPRQTARTALDEALAFVHNELNLVERELATRLESAIAVIPQVAGHLTFAGGKRFRPLVALLAARATGLQTSTAVTLAAAGEMLHSATLLHDDVIDNGDFRRGRPAARYSYGNGMAVLVGDFCLARALQAVAALGEPVAVQSMAQAVTRMAEGEIAQLELAGDWQMDRERYYMVIDRKTAALIAWCTSLAGLPAPAQSATLERYGLEIGYAFQISDDIIDYRSEVAVSGKARLQDLREGKVTLPLLLACEREPRLRSQVEALLRTKKGPVAEPALQAIGDQVATCGALQAAQDIAYTHAQHARASLDGLPQTPASRLLGELADFVCGRST